MAAAAFAVSAHAQTRQVTILHTNDGHGRYAGFAVSPGDATAQTGDPGRSPTGFARAGRVGGFAVLATAVEQIRRARGPDNVLLLNAGDTFSDDLLGNLTEGEAVMRLMRAVGFQFMALGNHDFDYGTARTRELERIGGFPLRGANVIDTETGAPFLGDPTRVVTVGDVRIGLLALGYHNTDQTGNKKNTASLRFTSGIEAAQEQVPRLRRAADVVVVVSHQGTAVDEVLAQQVPGIDVIIAGHSHDEISPPRRIGSTWLAQALSDTAALGELTLTVQDGRLTEVRGASHTLWHDQYPPDARIAGLVEALRASHRDRLDEVIAVAAERIGRQYKSESPFDVLVGEMLREETGAEVAFLPGVGYGVSLEAGPITREALYTLVPHPNEIVTLTLTGAQILSALEQSATNQRPENPLDRVGGLLQTAGMRWTVDLRRPPGTRIRNVRVGDRPLEPTRTYRAVTHSGMLQGLHRYRAFGEASEVRRLDRRLNEVVEARMRVSGTVRPPALGNITLIKDPE